MQVFGLTHLFSGFCLLNKLTLQESRCDFTVTWTVPELRAVWFGGPPPFMFPCNKKILGSNLSQWSRSSCVLPVDQWVISGWLPITEQNRHIDRKRHRTSLLKIKLLWSWNILVLPACWLLDLFLLQHPLCLSKKYNLLALFTLACWL